MFESQSLQGALTVVRGWMGSARRVSLYKRMTQIDRQMDRERYEHILNRQGQEEKE